LAQEWDDLDECDAGRKRFDDIAWTTRMPPLFPPDNKHPLPADTVRGSFVLQAAVLPASQPNMARLRVKPQW
jgi:hypothetical protein